MKATKTKCRYLCIVRHGQRMDHLPKVYPEYIGHPDAPLTPLGLKQASEAGRFLKSYIDKLKIEQTDISVNVQSSPFVRCLQTAGRICSEISIDEITLNYKFMEHLAGSSYPTNPLPSLES